MSGGSCVAAPAGGSSGLDLVALGEVMLELTPRRGPGGLREVSVGVAGDTFNVVAVAAGLGSRTGYVGWVGDDPVGDVVVRGAAARRVDLTGLRRARGTTGLYLAFVDDAGERTFSYYRDHSVAGRLSVREALGPPVCTARAVHASGITTALSPSAREAAFRALRAAADRDALASYDVNFRPALQSVEAAVADAGEAGRSASVLVMGLEDARALAGSETAADAIRWGWSLGARDVLVGEGADGASLGVGEAREILHVTPPPVTVRDTTGAGDALAGAFLHCRLAGWDHARCLRYACAAAARSVQGRGALGIVPTARQARLLMRSVRVR